MTERDLTRYLRIWLRDKLFLFVIVSKNMRPVKVKRIISVNNEVERHGAANLLPGDIDEKRNWLCEAGTTRGIVVLELECRTVITAIRIGNAHSAFIEILVGNIGDPTDKYQTLVPPSQFMNFEDSQNGKNTGQVKFFYQKDFRKDVANKEWEVIQLVCTQPFNKRVRFGICFIRVTGLGDDLVIVPEKEKEEQTPSVSHIRKDEPKEREPKIIGETSSFENSSKMKATSVKIKSPCDEDNRIQSQSGDYPDNRRNKYIGLEGSPAKKKKMEEGHKGSSSSGRVKKEIRETKSQKKKDNRSGRGRHFSRLMEDVFFTISGFKNPERGDIRNLALKMGAKYSGDWDSRCTHLICSFRNTPKYNQVKGKGKIVKKDWIEACYKDKKRYPWRRFALDPDEAKIEESEEELLARDGDTSEEDEKVDRAGPSSKEVKQRKKPKKADPCDTETDEDVSTRDTTDLPMPHLPDLLTDKIFHVDQNLPNCALIEKYIIAYNGAVRSEMSRDVDFYITETGGTSLKILREKTPKMKAVQPAWIWAMNSASQWISPWKFMLSV